MDSSLAGVYTDFQGVAKLKAAARNDADGALDEVARQFESLLLQMMLKSMREASHGEGLMDSDQSLFYRDMYDQQLAIHMANTGGVGLAESIKRQLGGERLADAVPVRGLESYRQRPVPASQSASGAARPPAPSPVEGKPTEEPEIDSPEAFMRQLWPHARRAAARLGQEPDALIAQAALETGWGRHMIRTGKGENSYNLFGIKADHRWPGERVTVPTLEFEQGVAVRKKAAFRAYNSFQESFDDYVDFLLADARYRPALEAGDSRTYVAALQSAGYATDPGYAEKIGAILDRPEVNRILGWLKSPGSEP